MRARRCETCAFWSSRTESLNGECEKTDQRGALLSWTTPHYICGLWRAPDVAIAAITPQRLTLPQQRKLQREVAHLGEVRARNEKLISELRKQLREKRLEVVRVHALAHRRLVTIEAAKIK